MKLPGVWSFRDEEVADGFDAHVREQLPWYDLATQSVACIVRHYLPEDGLIYDIGASTGNIGHAVKVLLRERGARMVAIEASPEMASRYSGPGECVVESAIDFPFERFDVAVAFLSLMFMSVSGRAQVLTSLRNQLRPGGAIVVVDKVSPPPGYAGTVLRRMTMHWKLLNGASAEDVLTKDLSLSGVQRPLVAGELGADAVEFFRLGEFAGWIIEPRSNP